MCIACYGIRVYPYMGFMVGQRYQCQDCQELMVIPLEFDEEEDYRAFRAEMLGDDETSEEYGHHQDFRWAPKVNSHRGNGVAWPTWTSPTQAKNI